MLNVHKVKETEAQTSKKLRCNLECFNFIQCALSGPCKQANGAQKQNRKAKKRRWKTKTMNDKKNTNQLHWMTDASCAMVNMHIATKKRSSNCEKYEEEKNMFYSTPKYSIISTKRVLTIHIFAIYLYAYSACTSTYWALTHTHQHAHWIFYNHLLHGMRHLCSLLLLAE